MISIKTPKDISDMREGGKILAQVLQKLENMVALGVTPLEIDQKAHDLILEAGAKPAFLGLYGFPNTTCISVNDEVVHGIPNNRKLKYGDIVSIDIGLIWKGWNLDMATTLPVLGDKSLDEWRNYDPKGAVLIDATKESLMKAIEMCYEGARLGDVGNAIESVIKKNKLSIVRELAGHGIGHKLHEDPLVLNFGNRGEGTILKNGMTLAIEPIVVEGVGSVKLSSDGHTYVSKDGKRAAHFEHTIAITKDGPIVLTQ